MGTKLKSKAIVGKRFKQTKNGKIFHRGQGARHLRSRKSKSRQRRQDSPKEVVTIRFARMIKRYL